MAMYVVNTGATPLSRGETIKNALEYTRGKDGFAKPAGTATGSFARIKNLQTMLSSSTKPSNDGNKGNNVDVSV